MNENPKIEIWISLLREEALEICKLQMSFSGHERYYISVESFDRRFECRVFVKDKNSVKMESIFGPNYPGIYIKPDKFWTELTFENEMKKMIAAKEFLIELTNKENINKQISKSSSLFQDHANELIND